MTPSPATLLIDSLVASLGKKHAHRALDVMLDQIRVVDLAALAYDWRSFWARPKQLFPDHDWRSHGWLTARGVGKTTACAHHIVEEVAAGRAKCIGLAAQNEDKTIEVQVGGILDASPPWARPTWHVTVKELRWENGAVAHAHTPEVPGAIRSHNFDLTWLSEVQSWPTATRLEAYLNFQFATRVGYARTVWDATPKRRHPLLRKFIERHAEEPERHVIVRGTIHENARNLGSGVIADLEREFGGTSQGREELLGEMLDDSENALVKQDWIDNARRHRPDVITYRVLGIDPAVTNRAGNDKTGIIDAGSGVDGQAYIFGDLSGKHPPGAWGKIVIDAYVADRIDLIVAETNKGGDLVVQNLRAEAGKRGLHVVNVGKDERPRHTSGTIYVREVHARGPKEDRAQPLATAYERGRVSHVIGAKLGELEDTLTTWEPAPGQRSPDALDAEVHAVGEILGFGANRTDPRKAFVGIEAAAKSLRVAAGPRSITTVMGGGGGGRI